MIPHHSTSLCFVHPDKTLSVDASQLSQGGRQPMFGRAYNDSADEGMMLVSHKTGTPVLMVVQDEKRNADNDITHWLLRSDRAEERRLNLPYTLQLTVWNT